MFSCTPNTQHAVHTLTRTRTCKVGDVLTKIDHASLENEETTCVRAIQMIGEGQGGEGRAFIEGFRRIPAFPRPTRHIACQNSLALCAMPAPRLTA